jgi:hypothetical protein
MVDRFISGGRVSKSGEPPNVFVLLITMKVFNAPHTVHFVVFTEGLVIGFGVNAVSRFAELRRLAGQ